MLLYYAVEHVNKYRWISNLGFHTAALGVGTVLAKSIIPLAQRRPLVGPMPHRLVESCVGQKDRSGRSDDPTDMQCPAILQLDAETHIPDVVEVRVLKLPQQLIHAFVETVVGVPENPCRR
jgi:hypothetical protein